MAEKVVEYLREWKWEVYQEVDCGGNVADIVAMQGPIAWVIETKLSFSLDLIGQARDWKGFANRISVATPMLKRGGNYKRNVVVKEMMAYYGFGQLVVTDRQPHVRETVGPRTHRKLIDNRVRDSLHEAQKTFAKAGTQGGRWTPFKQTCIHIRQVVARQPGIGLKELIDTIDHHYSKDSSARACISRLARQGVIEGIVCKREGRKLAFYLPEREESGKGFVDLD